MKIRPITHIEQIKRKYGIMKLLVGGNSVEMKTEKIDFKILEIEPLLRTSKHYHCKSETVFHVISGCAELETDSNDIVRVQPGDTIIISPNEPHRIVNKEKEKCIIIEVMSPPYNKADKYYLEP